MAEIKRIIQIMPADGWYAIYDGHDDGELWEKLACWALVEMNDGETEVVGMDADGYSLQPCFETSNFVRYEHESRRSKRKPLVNIA